MTERLIPTRANVPSEMVERAQWLLWRFEQKAGEKKPRKVPYYANGSRRTGEQGSASDRGALVDFTSAAAALASSKGKFTGLGFAFLPGDGLIGIDLDAMIDGDTGEISERGANIISACASYTEFSPSGKGVHIICSGETETFKSNEVGVEVFAGRQFFTVTGHPYPGTPATISPLPEKVLKRLKATVASGKKRDRDGKPATAPAPAMEGRAKVESALAFVSPDCGYDDWIKIGMAIHAELGDGALDVFDAWSARGSKYPGQREVAHHWKSFKPGAITGATIFSLAMTAGWNPPKPAGKRAQRAKPAGPAFDADAPEWKKALLYDRGDLKPCLANVHDIVAHDPAWCGVVAFNEFDQRSVKRKPPPFPGGEAGEWDGTDDSRAAMWLSRQYRFTPSTALVAEAIEVHAKMHAYHPVRDWLRTLRWDGVSRLQSWMEDCMGVAKTEFSIRVSKWFLIGMVARVMSPGVKFDYCLVLEGAQGRGKSSALAALGGEWFGDTDIDLQNKDGMAALQGKWLYEFAELGSLARTEAMKQKSFLSRQMDEYRPPYGRRQIRVPRQTVFAGSTNEWEWNKDPTGGRRFWPVEVGQIDLALLAQQREQLFAEALVLFEQGERFFPSAEEQRELFDPEQLKREQGESLVDALYEWVHKQYKEFPLAEAGMDGLKLDAGKLTRDMQTRIGIALRKLGCGRIEKRHGSTRYWYTPPVQDTDGHAEVAIGQAQQHVGDR